jgi:hypothetical protein
MSTPPVSEALRELPRPSRQARWWDPCRARAWGWEAVFGPGPFEVVRLVDRSDQGLGTGVVVRTGLGEREISAVWLALADEPGHGPVSRRASG